MRFLKFIVPMLLVFQIAVFAQSFEKSSVKTFTAENCKTVGKDPLLTVCVESASEEAKYTKRLAKAVRKVVRDLLKAGEDSEKTSDNPIPHPGGSGKVDCTLYACVSPYTWHADCCGAPTYCDAYPNDPTYCNTNPPNPPHPEPVNCALYSCAGGPGSSSWHPDCCE